MELDEQPFLIRTGSTQKEFSSIGRWAKGNKKALGSVRLASSIYIVA